MSTTRAAPAAEPEARQAQAEPPAPASSPRQKAPGKKAAGNKAPGTRTPGQEAAAPRAGARTAHAPAAAHGYDFRDQVGHLLRKTYQRHVAIFQQHASDPNLTAVQFVTLCALRDHGPSSQSELVRATAVDQGTIRGIIDRLKARGLIALSPDPDDRRKVIAGLTARGSAALEEMVPCAQHITELTYGPLNPAERVALLMLLRKMLQGEAGE